jgi:hypothetical protein
VLAKAFDVRDWTAIWQIPAIGAAICLVLFIVLWRDKPGKLEEETLGKDVIEASPPTPASTGVQA